MMKKRLEGIMKLACLMLVITSTFAFSFLPRAFAAPTISAILPSFGNVGTPVGLNANITTSGGQYEVFFDEQLVANGSATDNTVQVSFRVPQTVAGSHVVMVKDLTTGENVTTTFTVTTAYSVELITTAKPFQESDLIPIAVNMTGGESGTNVVNVTVRTPTNTSFVKILEIVSSAFGNATTTVYYPTDFPVGANTSYVGNYAITLNTTMASSNFSVILTNSTEYHRTQSVNIRALYGPNENVTLTIAGKGVNHSVNLTDPSGLINYDWAVPTNASVGNYSVTVVSLSKLTIKSPPDTQNFTIPGFGVNITAKNLAGDVVSSVNVTAFENGTSVASTLTTSAGLAALTLETGHYTCTAQQQSQKVGELDLEISEAVSLDIVCNLTNLRVRVISLADGTEINIPDAGVYLTPINTTSYTDVNGTTVVHSLLPSIAYTLNVTRYNTPFNYTIIPQLLVNDVPVAWFDVKVNMPTLILSVTTLKSDGQPLSNILVKTQEMAGVPLFQGLTDSNGNTTFTVPIGKYTIWAYDPSGVILNSTTEALFTDMNVSVHCDLYGLTVTVRVVDYFGQGIANINVKLEREGQAQMSTETQADGTATFNNVIGGDMEVALYIGDSAQPVAAKGLVVENSTSIQLRMDNYVVFAGLLVQTSIFATIIIIVLILVFVLAIELYRIRRPKVEKGESTSTNKES